MVARSMRVGGSARPSAQSRGRARAAFAPWEHQLEAIERVLQTIEAQDAAAMDEVRVYGVTGYRLVLCAAEKLTAGSSRASTGSCCSTAPAPARR